MYSYTNQGTGTFTKRINTPTEIPIKCVTGNQDVVVSGKNIHDYSYWFQNNKWVNISFSDRTNNSIQ